MIRTTVPALPRSMKPRPGCERCSRVGGKLVFVPWEQLKGGGPVKGMWLCPPCKTVRAS